MVAKGKTTGSTTRKKGCWATVAQRLSRARTAILGITGPLEARIALGMSQREIGIELGNVHPNGRYGKPFTRSTVCHWEHDKTITGDTQAAYLVLLRRWLTEKTRGRMDVRIRFGRRWRLVPMLICECGRPFRLRRVTDKRCKRCASKRR